MIKLASLLQQVEVITDMDELDSACSLFDFWSEKGVYTKLDSCNFNKTYTNTLNRILAKKLCDIHKLNYLNTLQIVALAPAKIKEDMKGLSFYVIDVTKNQCGKNSRVS